MANDSDIDILSNDSTKTLAEQIQLESEYLDMLVRLKNYNVLLKISISSRLKIKIIQ